MDYLAEERTVREKARARPPFTSKARKHEAYDLVDFVWVLRNAITVAYQNN